MFRDLTKYLEAGRSPSWSIQLSPSELDCRLWAAKNVKIFDANLDDFVVRIRRKMNA